MTDAPIKLMLADVDGTLVTNDKVLTDRAIAAVGKLRDAGITFAVTSGRPPEYDCAFTPQGSAARIGEGGAFALGSSTQLRSQVIGRALQDGEST